MADPMPRAVEASASADVPVARFLSIEATPFLDPDVNSITVNKIDINRTPVNVGKYLDPNGESSPLSGSDAGGIEKGPINVGEYLEPDHNPHQPLITNNVDSGNTHSDVGYYLDPDAEFPEALNVEPLNRKHVGSLLEVG